MSIVCSVDMVHVCGVLDCPNVCTVDMVHVCGVLDCPTVCTVYIQKSLREML